MRQLSRRVPRRDVVTRQSMGSEAGMLTPADDTLSSPLDGSRARSLSGSSALLLSRAAASDGRASAMVESASGRAGSSRGNSSGLSPTVPKINTALHSSGYQQAGSSTPRSSPVFGMQSHDPYYRPPRPRKKTMDTDASGEGRAGASSNAPRSAHFTESAEDMDGPSERETPMPAYIPAPKDDLDLDDARPPRKDKDYAVREVDFYYRVRGPPLSHTGTRKLKTGPADPTGPVSSATGFFRNLLRGKTKEKGKGFEVVRSTRAPPQGIMGEGEEFHEPYRDEPEEGSRPANQASDSGPYRDKDGPDGNQNDNDNRPDDQVPSLPPVDSGGGIELPNRMGSQNSSHAPSTTISRHNSTRQPSVSSSGPLGAVAEATTNEPRDPNDPDHVVPSTPTTQLQPTSGPGRLPFSTASSPSRDRDFSVASTAPSVTTTSSRRVGNDPDGSVRSRVDRPSSMGYVASHRTQDNIHQASPDDMSFAESAAELVDDVHTDTER